MRRHASVAFLVISLILTACRDASPPSSPQVAAQANAATSDADSASRPPNDDESPEFPIFVPQSDEVSAFKQASTRNSKYADEAICAFLPMSAELEARRPEGLGCVRPEQFDAGAN